MPTLSRADEPSERAAVPLFEAPLSRALLKHLEQIAPTDATVLIVGDTGTGKEIVARYLHDHSARASAPFVAVNCGALSSSLLESELFGHERGAFTGAFASKPGWFEAANHGTLFLDEVADLPLAGQVKLLRVLQEREVVRIGARRAAPIDVRLIAATNANLDQAVADGRFREDLYYRLHVAHVALAPLCDRLEDVLPLARHFLTKHARRLGIGDAELTEDACARLLRHRWPGNIRELENVIHRALLTSPHGRIAAADLRFVAAAPRFSAVSNLSPLADGASSGFERRAGARRALEAAVEVLLEEQEPELLEEIGKLVLCTAYRFSEMNQVHTARLLGVSRNVIRARLLRHGLLVPAAEPPPSSVDGEDGAIASSSRARHVSPLSGFERCS
jgi:DNA-binding NtrC family response regulator